jgi:hypothetical protein
LTVEVVAHQGFENRQIGSDELAIVTVGIEAGDEDGRTELMAHEMWGEGKGPVGAQTPAAGEGGGGKTCGQYNHRSSPHSGLHDGAVANARLPDATARLPAAAAIAFVIEKI